MRQLTVCAHLKIYINILWMGEILHQLISDLPHDLQVETTIQSGAGFRWPTHSI